MTDHLRGLNPAQEKAVLTTEGPLLVLAGAGTGKTRVVTSRIAHLVSKGVPPHAIGAVTFTNKAAKEMAQRAAAFLKGRTEGLTVSTFHSLGARLLRDYGTACGVARNFTIADPGDQEDLRRGRPTRTRNGPRPDPTEGCALPDFHVEERSDRARTGGRRRA